MKRRSVLRMYIKQHVSDRRNSMATTLITYEGFNEDMEQSIRKYMSECENITGEREILFGGEMTVGEQYNLTILTKE